MASATDKAQTRSVFFILLATQAVSLVGSRMTAFALGIWVFTQTNTATPLLLTSFFAELPGMVGGGLAGVLVDRWNRRLVMILADAGQALGSLFLLWSFFTGSFQIWHLYLVSLVQGVFATLQAPAQNAVVTVLVPEAQREPPTVSASCCSPWQVWLRRYWRDCCTPGAASAGCWWWIWQPSCWQ
jgi:MFS family permease